MSAGRTQPPANREPLPYQPPPPSHLSIRHGLDEPHPPSAPCFFACFSCNALASRSLRCAAVRPSLSLAGTPLAPARLRARARSVSRCGCLHQGARGRGRSVFRLGWFVKVVNGAARRSALSAPCAPSCQTLAQAPTTHTWLPRDMIAECDCWERRLSARGVGAETGLSCLLQQRPRVLPPDDLAGSINPSNARLIAVHAPQRYGRACAEPFVLHPPLKDERSQELARRLLVK